MRGQRPAIDADNDKGFLAQQWAGLQRFRRALRGPAGVLHGQASSQID